MKTIKTKEVIVTPEKALEILKTNKRNRPLKKNWVMFFADQMDRGLWKFNGESIIISADNVLLDGQHRLAAVVKSNKSQKFIIVYGIDQEAFNTIDVGTARTAGDMLSIDNVKNGNKIAGIIKVHEVLKRNNYQTGHGASRLKLSKQEIVYTFREDEEFWNEMLVIARRYYSKLKILSVRSIGGYYAYLIKEKKHDVSVVNGFFNQLFYFQGAENNSINILRDKLLKEVTGRHKMTTKYKHAMIVKAWNAYIKGKEYKTLSYNIENEPMPELI